VKKKKRLISLIAISSVLLLEICIVFLNKQNDGKFVLNITSMEPTYHLEQPSQTVLSNNKININTATKAELMLLPGVGDIISDRIIEYRETHGGFKTSAR